MDIIGQLRPGRHQWSRDEVMAHQRDRIFQALESVMSATGYVETSVADIIKAAGVSRQTFYELFSSKQDCFLASYARRQELLIELLVDARKAASPMDQFASLLRNYLAAMASDPAQSRLYLTGVYAAGPQAIAARLDMQQQFVDVVASVFGARAKQDRFMCHTVVAVTSTMVTNAVLEDDPQAVLDLYEPLIRVTERLMDQPRRAHSTKR